MFVKSIIKFGIMLVVKMLLLASALFVVVRLPGRSTLNYYGYSIELSTGVLVGGTIICFLFFHQFLVLGKWVRSLPTGIKKQWTERQKNKSKTLVLEAFNIIAAGDSKQALEILNKARELSKEDIFNSIFTAQATFNQGNDAESERQFTALLQKEETRFLGYRGLVLLKTRQKKLDQAHYFLQQALRERPDSPWVLGQLFNWNVEHLSFSGAETILEQLRIGGYLSKTEIKRKKAVLLWVKASHDLKKNDFEGFYESVLEALTLAPELTQATLALVTYYGESNRQAKAWKCLKKGYTINPHPDFLEVLKKLFQEKNSLEIYQQGQELTKLQGLHPVTHWLLANLAIEAKLWGQARLHLAALGQGQPTNSYFELRAELERQENPTNIEAIQTLYNQASRAPRAPVWVCQSCHVVLQKWEAFCPSCHSFDLITWGEEEKIKQSQANKIIPMLTRA